MNHRSLATLAVSLSAASGAFAQSVWLPEKGQLVVAPAYAYQTFDEFLAGKTKTTLPADIVQQTGSIGLEYGLTPKFAVDATIGYTRVDFDPPGAPNTRRDGLDDTRLGLRYRFIDEDLSGRAWVPAVGVRIGGIIAGTYDVPTTLPPINPGDGANGFETSLLLGKTFGQTGFGAYADLGYRVRDHDVPDDLFGSVGVFKHLGPVTLSFGYRHIQGLSGGDIGGPGFGTSYGFPQVKEINQLIEGGIAYTDKGGRSYQFTVAQKIDGRNTGDKLVFGVSVSIPIQLGR
jgi:hypothetical protein